jgi:hypothetical protein
MSTMTLRKRIALVAVTALGAGLLSVVAVPSANAAVNTAAGSGASTAAAADTLIIGTAANITGVAVLPTANNSTTASTAASSVGLINVSDIAGGLEAGTTQTAVLLSTGTLVVSALSASGKLPAIVVTGGTLTTNNGAAGVNAGRTVATGSGTDLLAVAITPNAGATSMTVQLYTGASASVTAPATGSLGLKGQITVTIASAADNGVYSAARSGIFYTGAVVNNQAASDGVNTGSYAYNTNAYLTAQLRDVYGSILTSATALTTVTATNGALVSAAIAASGSATDGAGSPLTTSAFVAGSTSYNATYPGISIRVANPTAAPLSTVVTVTRNGVVVGTKAITFAGEVARVVLSSPGNGTTGGASGVGNVATLNYFDSAGNELYPTGTASWPTGSAQNDPAAASGSATGIASITQPVRATSAGSVTFTCSSTAGKGTIGLAYTNLSGSVIRSNKLDVTCAGAPVTYTVSADKASYVPGDIATFTITFKDSLGNIAGDAAVAELNKLITVDGSQITQVVTGPKTAAEITAGASYDETSNGVIKYKYVVGSTLGSYQAIVSAPKLNSALTGQAAQTVAYKVAASTTGVTNEDVLKAIVSLIASINKQIAALQKALLRR